MDYRDRWEHKDYLQGKILEGRIRLFQIVLLAVLLGFSLNFWYLQGVHGEEYADRAENNRLRRIPTPPTRGVIFDAENEVIASTRPSLNLVLRRERLKDVDEQLRRLAPILDTTYEALNERLDRMKKRPLYEPVVLREDVRLEELAQIEARRELFPAMEVQETARRNYPHDGLFGHVLGYVGEVEEDLLIGSDGTLQGGDIVGKSGIERAYDEHLRGVGGWNLVSVNNLGRRMGSAWLGREPEHGLEMRLTLDLRLQESLRLALGDETGAGVFMDPWTGEVLAIASSPSYDPNRFANGITSDDWDRIANDPRRPLLDRALASYYAPGSTFKIVMAAVGLETRAITPEETIYCSGSAKVYGHRRLCWKRGGHGSVNLRTALAHSCNVYFYQLAKRLDIGEIHHYGDQFNLGRTTGVDVPGEADGILPSREWKRKYRRERWYPGDTISVAIGQGLLAVTPIQMATMISAVATDGQIPRPRLDRRSPVRVERLDIKPWTFSIIRDALRQAVAQGTGRRADLDSVAVAGKTGTAQVFKHSAGIDADELPKAERDHAWFVGYAPAHEPQIAFAVVVEHGGHGGTSAAPVVRAVLERFFNPDPDPAEIQNQVRARPWEREEGESGVRTPALR